MISNVYSVDNLHSNLTECRSYIQTRDKPGETIDVNADYSSRLHIWCFLDIYDQNCMRGVYYSVMLVMNICTHVNVITIASVANKLILGLVMPILVNEIVMACRCLHAVTFKVTGIEVAIIMTIYSCSILSVGISLFGGIGEIWCNTDWSCVAIWYIAEHCVIWAYTFLNLE